MKAETEAMLRAAARPGHRLADDSTRYPRLTCADCGRAVVTATGTFAYGDATTAGCIPRTAAAYPPPDVSTYRPDLPPPFPADERCDRCEDEGRYVKALYRIDGRTSGAVVQYCGEHGRYFLSDYGRRCYAIPGAS